MIGFVPVLADIDAELIRAAVIILFVVLGGIAQLISKFKQVKPGGPTRPLPLPELGPEEKPVGVPKGGKPRPAPARTVADEVEEFLRRAAERNQRKGMRSATPQQKRQPAPIRAETVPEKPVGGEVAEHVREFLDEKKFVQRAGKLGSEVSQVSQEIDQHLHQTFDRAVSKLTTVPGQAAVASTVGEADELENALAEGSLSMSLVFALADPDSIRQAILLNEVLRRPEDRWA